MLTTYTYFYTEPTPWGYASCKSCDKCVNYLREETNEWLALDQSVIYGTDGKNLIVRCDCGVFKMNTEHSVSVPVKKCSGVYAKFEVVPFILENTIAKRPTLTVDVIVQFGDSEILVVKRGPRTKPEQYRGCYVLPGGHVDYGETVKKAAVRELLEETGLDLEPNCLQFLTIADDLMRDPRKHSISLVYTVKLPYDYKFIANPSDETEISAIERVPISTLLTTNMGFDHQIILRKFNLIT